MSFNVDTIAPFRKEAKKLIKKYPSLKKNLLNLEACFHQTPLQALLLVIIATKYVWPSPQKAKENPVAQGSLHISMWPIIPFS